MRNKGFTLIELVVVIAVLAILVTIGIPRYLGYTKEANLTKLKHDARIIQDASDRYYIDHNDWPFLLDENGDRIIISDLDNFEVVYKVEDYDESRLSTNPDDEGGIFLYKIDFEKLNPYIRKLNSDTSYFAAAVGNPEFGITVLGLKSKPDQGEVEEPIPEEPEEGQFIWDKYEIKELVSVRGSAANVGGLLFSTYMSYPGYLDLKSDRDYLVTIDYEYEGVPSTVTKKSSSYWQNGYSNIEGFTHHIEGDRYLEVDYISGRADEEALWSLVRLQFNIVEYVLPKVFDIDIYSIVADILDDLGFDCIEDVTDIEGFRNQLIAHSDIQDHSESERIEALFYFLVGGISFDEVLEIIPEFSNDDIGILLYLYDYSIRENAEELIYGGDSWMIVISEISEVKDKDITNIRIEELVPVGTVSSQSRDYPEDGIQDGYWYTLK